MIVEKYICVPITNKNVTCYKNKGFDCKVSEILKIPISKLDDNSTVKEKRICDVCGKEFIRPHYLNINSFNSFGKDVCGDCFRTNKEIRKIVQEKREETFLKKYGEKNPMYVPGLPEKIKQTMLERYGVENASQVEEFKKKQEETMINLYGAPKALQVKQFQEKFVNTMTKNNSVKTSSQQISCYNMLIDHGYNAKINVPFSTCILDVLIIMEDGTKIDFEYDGMHWHNENTKVKERRRDEFLKSNGFKIMRIKSERSVPTWEQIESCINYLMEDEKHKFSTINIDEDN